MHISIDGYESANVSKCKQMSTSITQINSIKDLLFTLHIKKERLEKYNAKLLELGDAFNRDDARAGGLGRAEPMVKRYAVPTAGMLKHLKCNYFNASSTSILYDN